MGRWGRKGGLQGRGCCPPARRRKAFYSISHPLMKRLASRGLWGVVISSRLQGGFLQRQLMGSAKAFTAAPAGETSLWSSLPSNAGCWAHCSPVAGRGEPRHGGGSPGCGAPLLPKYVKALPQHQAALLFAVSKLNEKATRECRRNCLVLPFALLVTWPHRVSLPVAQFASQLCIPVWGNPVWGSGDCWHAVAWHRVTSGWLGHLLWDSAGSCSLVSARRCCAGLQWTGCTQAWTGTITASRSKLQV